MTWTKEDDMDSNTLNERRAIARNLCKTIEPVRLCLEEGEFVARVQDISVAGFGILIRQPLEPGIWLVVKPVEPKRRLTSELRAEVRHTRKCDTEGDDYLVGCRFSRLLTLDDVMALGQA
jgi:hypothetical protein